MKRSLCACALTALLSSYAMGQSLGNAGTIEGKVVDPSGAAVPKAAVSIQNSITGYRQSVLSAADGSFRIGNIPPNPYHLETVLTGFSVFTQDVTVRSAVPVHLDITLSV